MYILPKQQDLPLPSFHRCTQFAGQILSTSIGPLRTSRSTGLSLGRTQTQIQSFSGRLENDKESRKEDRRWQSNRTEQANHRCLVPQAPICKSRYFQVGEAVPLHPGGQRLHKMDQKSKLEEGAAQIQHAQDIGKPHTKKSLSIVV